MKIQHAKYDFDLDYCHFNYMTISKTKPNHSCHFTMAADYHYFKDYKSSRWWWRGAREGKQRCHALGGAEEAKM
jgi:hypothetical protein